MYTKPIFYKAYAVLIAIAAGFGLLGSIISLFAIPDGFYGISILFKIFSIIGALIAFVCSYINFTSIFSFAEMIEYEQGAKIAPFKKGSYVLSSGVYRAFGKVMFVLSVISGVASVIGAIVICVISIHLFWIALLILIVTALSLLLSYITYYCRYNAFGNLIDVLSSDKPDDITLLKIKNTNTNMLRGYCTFLYVVALVMAALSIIAIFVAMGPLSSAFGVGSTIALILLYLCLVALGFITLSIEGCYFDNLAKMVEHYMIEYKLL